MEQNCSSKVIKHFKLPKFKSMINLQPNLFQQSKIIFGYMSTEAQLALWHFVHWHLVLNRQLKWYLGNYAI